MNLLVAWPAIHRVLHHYRYLCFAMAGTNITKAGRSNIGSAHSNMKILANKRQVS